MEDPKRIDKLEQNVERLNEAERNHDFIIRDSNVKITFAQGLADLTYRKFTQLETDMVQLRAEMRELQASTDHNFEDMHKKLDTQELMTKDLERTVKDTKATMATKDDIIRLEGLIKQLLPKQPE